MISHSKSIKLLAKVGFSLVALGILATLQAQDRKPNVILIYADDLGIGLLSKYGQKHFTTPHIDSLAERGMTMNRYYGNIYCAPARYSLLTGMHNGHKDGDFHSKGGFIIDLDTKEQNPKKWQEKYDAHIASREKAVPIPEGEVFLAEIAQNAGLVTSQFGKLDIGFLTWHERLERHGWDHYVGYYDHKRAHSFYPMYLWKNGAKLPLKGNTRPDAGRGNDRVDEKPGSLGTTYSQDIFIEEIVDFISTNKDKPFFLYHSTQLPHGPVAINELHPEVKNNNALTPSEKMYASMVKMLDDHVGIILAEIKKQGLEDDTLILFTSDNGHETYYRNQKGKSPKGFNKSKTGKKWRTSDGDDTFNGAAGMVGLKRDVYEGGIHCPMFAMWPGKIAPNSSTEHIATHYDVMATLADLLDQPVPEGKDSLSFLPALLGEKDAKEHDWIYLDGFLGDGGALITKELWKLITFKNGDTQLYSLKDDFLEEKDVADQHPEIVQKLKRIAKQQKNKQRADLKALK